MISPSSPSVQVTSVTCAPSAAYLAIVAPVRIDSSSGCACTSSSRLPEIMPSEVMLPEIMPPEVMAASLRVRRNWQDAGHDREFPAPGGQDQAVHARRAAFVPHLARRGPGGLPAHQGRQR